MLPQQRRVVLRDLPNAERERFYSFLVANDVEFVEDPAGTGGFVATIRVVPPKGTGGPKAADKEQSSPKSQQRFSSASQQLQSTGSRGQFRQPQPPTSSRTASQALLPSPINTAAASADGALAGVRRRYRHCCELLPAPTEKPKAMHRSLLVQFCEDVYDARYAIDAAAVRAEASGERTDQRQSFPESMVFFATKRHGLRRLVGRNCWAVLVGIEANRAESPGAELFARFLEESYGPSELLFFLLARSAVQRAVATQPRGAPRDSVARLDARQCKTVVWQVVDARRQQLRLAIVKRMDEVMVERGADSLEAELVLSIATAEYHAAQTPPASDVSDTQAEELTLREPSTALLANGLGSPEPSIEQRQEAQQMAQRLVSSFAERGESVGEGEAYDWALACSLRTPTAAPLDATTSLPLTPPMPPLDATASLPPTPPMPPVVPRDSTPGSRSRHDSTPGSRSRHDSVPGAQGPPEAPWSLDAMSSPPLPDLPAHADFERDLEAHVRRLLLSATESLVAEVLAELPGAHASRLANQAMEELVAEFAPVTDAMMEALVKDDFSQWLGGLGVDQRGDFASQDQRVHFSSLHAELQRVLAAEEFSSPVVEHICREVVQTIELRAAVQAKAQLLEDRDNLSAAEHQSPFSEARRSGGSVAAPEFEAINAELAHDGEPQVVQRPGISSASVTSPLTHDGLDLTTSDDGRPGIPDTGEGASASSLDEGAPMNSFVEQLNAVADPADELALSQSVARASEASHWDDMDAF